MLDSPSWHPTMIRDRLHELRDAYSEELGFSRFGVPDAMREPVLLPGPIQC